jgi:hypothetical protein
MPLDVLGRTRATLVEPTSPTPRPMGPGNLEKLDRAGDRPLQLLVFNEEFLVSAGHQPALITSLPFVHTARRSYRSNGPVRPSGVGPFAIRATGSRGQPKSVEPYRLEEGEVVTRF